MFVKASTFGVKKYEDTKLKAPAVTHTRTTVKGTFGVKKDEDTCSSLKVIKDNKSTKKTFHEKHVADTQGETLFEDDNGIDNGVLDCGQHGVVTTAIGTSTSRATGSSLVSVMHLRLDILVPCHS